MAQGIELHKRDRHADRWLRVVNVAILVLLAWFCLTTNASAQDDDCENGYFCPAPLKCSSNGEGCLPPGSVECADGTSYCEPGSACCAEGCVPARQGCAELGENRCRFAYDGRCDEGTFCEAGTDTADCVVSNGTAIEETTCFDQTISSEQTTTGQDVCHVEYCVVSTPTNYCADNYVLVESARIDCGGECMNLKDCLDDALAACLSESSEGDNTDLASQTQQADVEQSASRPRQGCNVVTRTDKAGDPIGLWFLLFVLSGAYMRRQA